MNGRLADWAVGRREGLIAVVLAIVAALVAVAGIVSGAQKKSTPVIVVSTIGLVLMIAVWVYLFRNSY